MFSRSLILLLLCCHQALRLEAASIGFEDCGSEYYLDEVDIEGCTQLPCCLFIGEQHHISMKFYASTVSTYLKQSVYLILKSVYSGVDVSPENPCDQISCPINHNLDFNFSASMNINDSLVSLDGELYWTMLNEEDTTVICMKTDIVLKEREKMDNIEEVCN